MTRVRLALGVVAVVVAAVVILVAGEEVVTPDEAPAADRAEQQNSEAAAPAPPDPDACFRVGDMRPQVRRAMGEPDSIAFRLTWFYGTASLTYDPYGTVIDYADPDETLELCSR